MLKRDHRRGPDRPDRHRVRVGSPRQLRRETSRVSVERLAAAMRQRRAALYRAVDRRASEMERGALALRVSTSARQDVTRRDVM